MSHNEMSLWQPAAGRLRLPFAATAVRIDHSWSVAVGRRPGVEILICALRPLAEPSVNISFQILPLFCSYVIPCPVAGALVAPKTCDLQGVASRSFLHVAAGHPSRCEGERYGFRVLCGPVCPCEGTSEQTVRTSVVPTLTLPIIWSFRYKGRKPDFADL